MKPDMKVILAGGPDRDEADEEGREGGATMSAAEDLISAVKAGDADAVAVALEDFLRACGAVESEKSDDEY